MSKLDKLIKELCPNGVEYKNLGDIGQVKMCKRILKAQTNESGGIPFYKIGNFGGNANSYISEELFKEYKEKYSYPKVGEILISAAGTIGRTVVYDGEPAYYQDSNIVWLSHDESLILNTFLKYCYELQPWNISSGGTIARLYNDNILKAKVPVPPLEVQREIVRILDSFTLLTAELTAELTARKKQYEYYRDKLLVQTCDDVEKISLSDVVSIKNGKDYKHLKDGKYPVYGSGGIMTYKSEYTYDKPSVLIPRKGSLSNLFYVEEPFWNVDTVFYTEIDESKLIPKYLYYLLQKEHLESLNTAGGVPSLTQTVLNKLSLVIPSLNRQRKIVDVLDNFEKICNDLNIGLPAEIEARKKQYEYYRDVLLTFAETGSTILTDRQTEIRLIQYVFGYCVVTLDEISENCDSKRKPVTKMVRDKGMVPYYGASGIVDYVKEFIFDGDYLLVSEDGANLNVRVTPIAFSASGKIWVNNHAHVLKFDNPVTKRYLEIYLNSIDISSYITGAAQPKLNQKNLNSIPILLPEISSQKRIVDILDRFDSLCNDITSGLPAEIEARKKQYEYYRDKLLDFK